MEYTWWRHQIKTFSALLTLCTKNAPFTTEFPLQRPVPRGFDIFFDLRLKKRLSKHSRRRWFETPSVSLWRHCHESITSADTIKWWRELWTAWILSRIIMNHMYLNCSANYVFLIYIFHLLWIVSTNYEVYSPIFFNMVYSVMWSVV